LDFKTPGSTGSDAAHQMYSPKTLIIWKKRKYHYTMMSVEITVLALGESYVEGVAKIAHKRREYQRI